jgi:acyl dehydratase
MTVSRKPWESGLAIAREMRRAIAAVVVGAVALSLLVVAVHRGIAWTDDVENQFHRRAAVLAERLYLTLRSVQMPVGLEDADASQLREPEAFAGAAEHAYVDALAVTDELVALHDRYAQLGGYERAMQRLAHAADRLQRLHRARADDRLAFAMDLATAPTYLEIVAYQIRRQHEASLQRLLEARQKLVVGLEIVGVLVLVAIVLATRGYVRRSFAAVNAILAHDARRSLQLSDSRDALDAALRERDVLRQGAEPGSASTLAPGPQAHPPKDAPMKTLFLEDLTPGRHFGSREITVDEERIRTFAAEFDPQPFHLDAEAARGTMFGGLAASGWHTAALTMRLLVESELRPDGGLIGAGFDELRWLRPVRPGDRLHLDVEVLEARASRSKPDQGIVKIRTTTLNHEGEPVQVSVGNILVRRRDSA